VNGGRRVDTSTGSGAARAWGLIRRSSSRCAPLMASAQGGSVWPVRPSKRSRGEPSSLCERETAPRRCGGAIDCERSAAQGLRHSR
jgi:hypothetical protein